MRYTILLHQRADGKYQASVPLMPELSRVGETRDETLRAIEQALIAALATTEVDYLDLPALPADHDHPWLATAGIFADDPTLEPMLADIYRARDTE